MRCSTHRLLGLLVWLLASHRCLGAENVPRDLKLPASVTVAIYMPAQIRRFHGMPGVFESGRTLEDTVLSAGQDMFTRIHMAEPGGTESFGLLLALHPQIRNDSGKLNYTLEYAAFAEGDEPLVSGTETMPVDFTDRSMGGPLDSVSYKAARQVMIDILARLHPDAGKYPDVLDLKSRSLAFAVKKDKPWGSGTGFFINARGQLLTAAHVVANCARIDVKRDGNTLPATVLASSNVVDLAALDTGSPAPAFLPFRRSLDFELGESVTGAGFPLQELLSDSPNLTRGNVSARGGLNGSAGQLQFSAPTQPGSSGGPVVSDGGEVLGVTVGTLNPAALAKQGVIPQNINFALEARYAVRFLQKNALEFGSVDQNPHGDLHTANQAALGAIVKISCYE